MLVFPLLSNGEMLTGLTGLPALHLQKINTTSTCFLKFKHTLPRL
jgi:hypothetical protein